MRAVVDIPASPLRMRQRPSRRQHVVALIPLLAVACWVLYAFVFLQPRHDRDWEFGFEQLPSVSVSDDLVTIRHLRDYRLMEDGQVRPDFVDRTFHLSAVERAWFIVEPFPALPIDGFKGVAHTYFAFDIADQPPVTVSVEARRERGERFDMVLGMLNQYELMYIWATEQDTTGKRVAQEGNEVYMYPLLISRDAAAQLLQRLAATTEDIERRPRFYNSLTSNCTSELAHAANTIRPGAVPVSLAWWLPGYSVDQLYDLGFIPHDRPLSEIQQRYDVTATVRAILLEPDFSERLRASLADAN